MEKEKKRQYRKICEKINKDKTDLSKDDFNECGQYLGNIFNGKNLKKNIIPKSKWNLFLIQYKRFIVEYDTDDFN